MKKVFIISAVLLVVVLIFLGIYNFAFKKEKSATVVKQATEQIKTATSVAIPEKITAITDGPILGSVFDKKNQEIKFYDLITGLAWKMDADGKRKKQISSTKILGLKKVLWSPDNSKVLTMTQNGGANSFYMYDYLKLKATPFSVGLDQIVWDNAGTKIFYRYSDSVSGKKTINIANPDGSEWQKIADVDTKNILIASIPLSSRVSFWNYPSAKEETRFQITGVTGGEVKTLLAGRFGADYLWSPDGTKALVSSLLGSSANAMTLGVVSIDGEYQELGIPTMVSKAVWSEDSKTVFFALPGGIPEGVVMPNDYQENKFNTNDTFWKININTGEKERIVEVGDIKGKFDSSEIFLSATEDALYFVNRIDQKLYRIAL